MFSESNPSDSESELPKYKSKKLPSTVDQSGPGSDGNEGVLCIPQTTCITGASPSDCLISYSGPL